MQISALTTLKTPQELESSSNQQHPSFAVRLHNNSVVGIHANPQHSSLITTSNQQIRQERKGMPYRSANRAKVRNLIHNEVLAQALKSQKKVR